MSYRLPKNPQNLNYIDENRKGKFKQQARCLRCKEIVTLSLNQRSDHVLCKYCRIDIREELNFAQNETTARKKRERKVRQRFEHHNTTI